MKRLLNSPQRTFDRLAAAAAADLAGRDEWLELSAAGDVRVGVAAGVPAQLALLPCAHARIRASEAPMPGRSWAASISGPRSGR